MHFKLQKLTKQKVKEAFNFPLEIYKYVTGGNNLKLRENFVHLIHLKKTLTKNFELTLAPTSLGMA